MNGLRQVSIANISHLYGQAAMCSIWVTWRAGRNVLEF